MYGNETSPIPSPQYDQSPASIENEFQEILNNAQINFDPDAFGDNLENEEDIIVLEPIEFFEQAAEEEPAVPIENPPMDYDHQIMINFSISFVNDQYVAPAQEDGEEALDDALDMIENGPASPPDINAFIQMEE